MTPGNLSYLTIPVILFLFFGIQILYYIDPRPSGITDNHVMCDEHDGSCKRNSPKQQNCNNNVYFPISILIRKCVTCNWIWVHTYLPCQCLMEISTCFSFTNVTMEFNACTVNLVDVLENVPCVCLPSYTDCWPHMQ